jgi:hypothetical protein
MLRSRADQLLLLLILTWAWPALAFSQAIPDPKTRRVQLKISADADMKGVVQRSLEAELRRLPQVSLTDSFPQFTISVIVLEVATRSRKELGATFSVVVTEPYDQRVREFAELHLADDLKKELISSLSHAVKPLGHWLETASAADVPRVCRSIIQSFAKIVLTDPPRAAARVLKQ